MVDIHNHVLPNIDDGSKSMDMSISMLQHAFDQGVSDVINTVHYQHPLFPNIDFSIDRFKKIAKSLKSELEKIDISINIHFGAEVFYQNNLLKLIDEPMATLGNGKYMLIEFLPYHIPKSHKKTLFDLKMKGVTPIIAHPERYKLVQNSINIVYDWINAGCIIQIDAGSVIGMLGKKAKKTSRLLIEEGCCHILSSDAHNDSNRNFCIKDAYIYAKTIIGEDADLLVFDHPRAVIKGDDLYF